MHLAPAAVVYEGPPGRPLDALATPGRLRPPPRPYGHPAYGNTRPQWPPPPAPGSDALVTPQGLRWAHDPPGDAAPTLAPARWVPVTADRPPYGWTERVGTPDRGPRGVVNLRAVAAGSCALGATVVVADAPPTPGSTTLLTLARVVGGPKGLYAGGTAYEGDGVRVLAVDPTAPELVALGAAGLGAVPGVLALDASGALGVVATVPPSPTTRAAALAGLEAAWPGEGWTEGDALDALRALRVRPEPAAQWAEPGTLTPAAGSWVVVTRGGTAAGTAVALVRWGG